ncbi:MAG: hypothetical protein H7Y42_03595 [Chitinophagaceae bacterium]|nr:hypothetical protein [Chitinophagaceae bacterium]
MIASLYPSSLVQTGEERQVIVNKETPPEKIGAPSKEENRKFRFLGENRKQILVMVDYSDAVFLPEEELAFLTTMLSACKLDLGDIAIVNRHQHPDGNYKQLLSTLNSKIIFLFGVPPLSFGLPIDFPHYQVQNFSNATFLYSPRLEETKDDGILKSKLWVSLRRIFGI